MRKWIMGAFVGALSLILGVVMVNRSSDADETPAPADTTASSGDFDSAIDLLTVTRADTDVSCVQLVKRSGRATENVSQDADRPVHVYSWELGINAADLMWTDSYRRAFQAGDDQGKETELFTENCLDPLGAGDALNFWANHTTSDGTKLVDRNPWLAPWVGDPAVVIHAAAAQYMPLYLNEASLIYVQVDNCTVTETENCLDLDAASQEKVRQAIQAQYDWQVIAGRLNTLIKRTELVGVQEGRASVLNYHLLGDGLVVPWRDAAGNLLLPPIGFNDRQVNLPVLLYQVTEKDNPCPILEFGFNTGDKRFELFDTQCEQPPAPPPGSNPPPGTNPPPPGSTVPPTVTTVPPTVTTVPPTVTTLPPGSTVPPTTVTTLPPGSTVPPTTVPPTTVPPTVPPTTLKPKDPSKDVNVNPSVPPQVRGPGTTPIGVSPGPAAPVFDTPTGCNGPCPTVPRTTTPPPPPAPTTPATTSPVVPTTVVNSGDGQVGVTIPAGPPPSCPVDICG